MPSVKQTLPLPLSFSLVWLLHTLAFRSCWAERYITSALERKQSPRFFASNIPSLDWITHETVKLIRVSNSPSKPIELVTSRKTKNSKRNENLARRQNRKRFPNDINVCVWANARKKAVCTMCTCWRGYWGNERKKKKKERTNVDYDQIKKRTLHKWKWRRKIELYVCECVHFRLHVCVPMKP